MFSAAAAAVMIPMLKAVGRGWTYTIAAGIWVLSTPLLLVVMPYGSRWRKEKKREKAEETRVEELADEVQLGVVASRK